MFLKSKASRSKQAERMFCGECKKYIPDTIKWECGYCDTVHEGSNGYSFLHACAHCGKRPAAFSCPHCKTIWCLEKSGSADLPARLFNVGNPLLTLTNDEESRQRELKKKKEVAQWKIEEAKLLLELKDLEEKIAAKKPKSKMEALEMEFDRDAALFLGVREIARKRKKDYEELYRDDPEMLEDALLLLEKWQADRA
jgi:hypothetical protein